jgi:hypothetical protein
VLLALVIAGLVTLLLLLRRSRIRKAWDAELTAAEAEVAWFGRDLVPQLRGSGAFAGVSGGWAVAAPRVQALEDTLTRLTTTAPTDDRRTRAAAVQDAVRTARERMAGILVAGETAQWSLALDEVQGPLLAALVPVPPAEGGAVG